MSCSHAIVACAYTRQDAYSYLSDISSVNNIMNVYNENFSVVAMEEYWSLYQEDIVWHNDEMRRKKKGRPNNICIKKEIDTADKMIRLCNICHQLGHNRKNYPIVGGTSTS